MQAYVGVADGSPVAYGERWVDDDEQEVELARARRGAGRAARLSTADLSTAGRPGETAGQRADRCAG